MNQELFFETMEEGVREVLSETYEAVEVKLQSVTKNNNVTLCGLSAIKTAGNFPALDGPGSCDQPK